MDALLQKRHQNHLAMHVQPVVAGRAVRTQCDGDTILQHACDRGDATAQLEIAARTVRKRHIQAGHEAEILLADPYACLLYTSRAI